MTDQRECRIECKAQAGFWLFEFAIFFFCNIFCIFVSDSIAGYRPFRGRWLIDSIQLDAPLFSHSLVAFSLSTLYSLNAHMRVDCFVALHCMFCLGLLLCASALGVFWIGLEPLCFVGLCMPLGESICDFVMCVFVFVYVHVCTCVIKHVYLQKSSSKFCLLTEA